MLDSRVKIEGESISGSGANGHADVSVSGESRITPNIFAGGSAAKVNPLVRIYYSYNDANTGTHENGADQDNIITRAGANSTHGQDEGKCDSVANNAIGSGHKRTANDNKVGTKKRKARRSHQADISPESPLAESYFSTDTLRKDSCPDNLSSGNYTMVSLKKEASDTLDEEPISSFEKPDSHNQSEETADEEQDACKGLERFCLERDSQLLKPGESSLEELVVRSNLSMLELMRKRDKFKFDPGLICLPLSRFKPHQEDRSPDHIPTYVNKRGTQNLELQRLNFTIVQGRDARVAVSMSEYLDPSNPDHSSPQNLDNCAVTLQSPNDHQVGGKSKDQRKKDDSHSPSEACADDIAQRLRSTRANAVDHDLNASDHEISPQPATGKSFVVDLSCRVCSKTCVSLSHLTTHMRSHTGEKPFACAECDQRFSQSGNLTSHMRSHTGEKPFACAKCCKRFIQSGHLTRHMRSHTGEKPFACAKCDKTFSQSGNLTTHMRSHTGEKPFACAECDKRFSESGHLTRHMRSHTGEKPFACAKCDKRFSRNGHLTTHMRSHTGEKPYACAECNKRFARNGDLTTHMRSHTGEKPFACAECDKLFSSGSHLTFHMRSHTGDMPFTCTECDKRFSRNGHLTTHMRSHTGEKPYVCDECGKRFFQSSHLTSHMRSHTGEKPFACAECDKRFSESGTLTTHMRTHTGEKPFACAECDKKFSHSGNLATHMRSHIGEKPFACAECDRRYTKKSYLMRHSKLHTHE